MVNSSESYQSNLSEVLPAVEETSLDNGEDQIEIIVKYNGDLFQITQDFPAEVEILSANYAIVTLERDNIMRLYSYPQVESIELPKSLYLNTCYNLTSSCIRSVQDSKTYNLNGNGVIVAIIDSGIDYTHAIFQNADGTSRILYIWDQSGQGTPPAGFKAGAEYTQEQINQALASPSPLEIVPEMDLNGHGTAVAAIAAGNSGIDVSGVATEANIIVVKVGSKGSTSSARTTELMRAVKYVIDRARELSQPVAINISFGMNDGSHLGDSLFETYLSSASAQWKTSIVIPTGNEGAAGHHYAGQISSHQTQDIEFFTVSGIERFFISLWKDFVDSLSVEIIFPDGMSSGVIDIENQIKRVRMGNQMLTVIYGQPNHYSVNQEIYLNVQATSGFISAGAWKLKIIADRVVDGKYEMWLPTLEEVTDKTYFSNPTVYNTMTIPSTALNVIKVAGYNDRLGNIAEFSGKGNLNLALPNPDLAAPATGILTAKTGGGYDAFTGTSFAAPFVTGSAALMMEWGIVKQNDPFLYGERIKAFLRIGANRADNLTYPNPAFGYGTLCLNSTMSYLERYQWGGDNRWLKM